MKTKIAIFVGILVTLYAIAQTVMTYDSQLPAVAEASLPTTVIMAYDTARPAGNPQRRLTWGVLTNALQGTAGLGAVTATSLTMGTTNVTGELTAKPNIADKIYQATNATLTLLVNHPDLATVDIKVILQDATTNLLQFSAGLLTNRVASYHD